MRLSDRREIGSRANQVSPRTCSRFAQNDLDMAVNLHPTSLPSLTGTALKKQEIPHCPNGSMALGKDERGSEECSFSQFLCFHSFPSHVVFFHLSSDPQTSDKLVKNKIQFVLFFWMLYCRSFTHLSQFLFFVKGINFFSDYICYPVPLLCLNPVTSGCWDAL